MNDKIIEAVGMIDEELIAEARTPNKIYKFSAKKIVAVTIAAVLCLTLAINAAAMAYGTSVDEMLYAFFPSAVQAFTPVRLSCEYDGIRMEVISAEIDGDEAKVYISMQDLEGDRIDRSVDIFDSGNIRTPHDVSGSCQKLGFDEETKTVYFMVSLKHMNGENFRKDKVTFSVSKALTNKIHYSGIIEDIDLSTAEQNPETAVLNEHAYYQNGDVYSEAFEYLIPQGMLSNFTPGVYISAIGFIDGKLHVQTCLGDTGKTDNHGFYDLVHKDGTVISEDDMEYAASQNIAWWEYEGAYITAVYLNPWDYEEVFEAPGENITYHETVFNISPKEVANYRLYANDFVTCNTLIEGDWSVTFSLE